MLTGQSLVVSLFENKGQQSQESPGIVWVYLQYCVETATLFLTVVCIRCQPELGGDHEGTGTMEVVDYEASREGA